MLPTNYPIVTFIQGLVSIVESPFGIFKKANLNKNPLKDTEDNKQGIIYMVSGIIALVFLLLYINSNPVFSDLFSKIDLSFIEIGFIFTTIGLYLLIYGLVRLNANQNIHKLNSIKALIDKTELSNRDKLEYKIARLSIWIIGILLFIANITDLVVIFTGKLPEGITYSEYVHQGFNTLIFTLSLAIGLIIYFFRGQINYHKDLKLIKSASLFWILQNLLLALITAYKNFLYVEVYGLTYKRIAVFLGLLCVIIGFILSLKKLQRHYTNWLYFNKLTLYAFVSILLISFFPVDRLITKYNLSYSETIDIDYILNLSNPDLELLDKYIQDHSTTHSEYILAIHNKILNLSDKASNTDWQGWNFYISKYKIAQ
jgi:hypothetical protein